MLSKLNRLRNNKDIERVFKAGRGAKEGFLFLKSAKSELGTARFAFIVNRKVSKKASSRNKIKRRLREAVKILLPQIKTGFDAVIVAQGEAEGKSFSEIGDNIKKLFQKAGII